MPEQTAKCVELDGRRIGLFNLKGEIFAIDDDGYLEIKIEEPGEDLRERIRRTRAELVERAREIVASAHADGSFSGTVLIAEGEEILFSTAVGEASKRFHVANKLDTKFNLGSMNKMFTSVAVAQLAEREKLSFDDPISKYIDETWLPREITEKITVFHLLTHTSGLNGRCPFPDRPGSDLIFPHRQKADQAQQSIGG